MGAHQIKQDICRKGLVYLKQVRTLILREREFSRRSTALHLGPWRQEYFHMIGGGEPSAFLTYAYYVLPGASGYRRNCFSFPARHSLLPSFNGSASSCTLTLPRLSLDFWVCHPPVSELSPSQFRIAKPISMWWLFSLISENQFLEIRADSFKILQHGEEGKGRKWTQKDRALFRCNLLWKVKLLSPPPAWPKRW